MANEKNEIPRMETIKQASKIIGLAEYHVRQLVKQSKVKFVRTGKKYLINLDSLIEYLNKGETTSEKQNETERSNYYGTKRLTNTNTI